MSTSLTTTIGNKLFDFDLLGLVAVVVLAYFGANTLLATIDKLVQLSQAGQALYFIALATYFSVIGAIAHASITVKTPAGTVTAGSGTPPSQ